MAEHQLTCRGCGNQFEYHRRKAYCSIGCRSSQPVRSGRLENAANNQEHQCKVCDKTFKPKRAGLTTCCSRECGLIWSSAKMQLAKYGGRVWVRTKRNEPKRPAPVWAHYPPTPQWCADCGGGYYRSELYQRHCNDACANRATDKAKKRERVWKKLRRAIERGANGGERVDPFAVFDRDDWRCQSCGCKTPKRLRGKNKRNSPELDHIVSIAHGGAHTYRNTQLLCRACNGSKGSRSHGQLHLFPAPTPPIKSLRSALLDLRVI